MVGFKNAFKIDHIMTGQELCEILDIDYNEIIQKRKMDAEDNIKYFASEIMKIEEIKKYISLIKDKE